ncbi:hypothetical protein TIFTF001_020572 [Ficus carica]|uniref:Uncharacterized protein n=1 Tax=Ficus carica TaxID=3494 RepID=A0AA88A8T8_FICCA|nr:hypothetical protein TIFTF001_020572 [Ficus carica]
MSAHSFVKGRRSWTSFGNPYLPLIEAKSSSVKMEGGFTVRRNDSMLIHRGGLLNRAMGGIDRISAPDTVAGRLLSDASLLDSAPFFLFKRIVFLFRTTNDGRQFIILDITFIKFNVRWDFNVFLKWSVASHFVHDGSLTNV